MGYTIINDEATPNPAARRLVVEPAPMRIVSCRSRDENPDDPIVRALMDIESVTGVLVHERFISVNISPDSTWRSVKKQVAAALEHADG